MKIRKILFIIIFSIIIFMTFSLKVSAMTIVIDPGHGGKDSGSSYGDIVEKDVTMKIANYLKEYLNDYEGVKILMTHTGTTMSLEDRADFARNNQADLLISIHINSSNASYKNGAEAYVTYRTDLPKYNNQMTQLGNKILNNISKLGVANNGVATRVVVNSNGDSEYKYFDGSNGDYYAIIRRSMKGGHAKDLGDDFRDGSGVSAILVEHAYLSNSHDRELLDSDNDLRNLAKADCDAIVSQYGLIKNEIIDITEYLFDSKYYADMNSDLKAAFGYNENLLLNHYKVCGIREGRQASPVFDPKYYLNKYGDLKAAFGNDYYSAYSHFINCGCREGRAGSKFFDGNYYLNTYGDLQAAYNRNYTKALKHFALWGLNEGRQGSSEGKYYDQAQVDIRDFMFDANYYYNLYPDIQSVIGYNPDLLRYHYYNFGVKEGRQASPVFDPKYYLNSYNDLKSSFGNNYESAYNHFIRNGIGEGRRGSKEFDPKFYLSNYGDLSNTFGNNYSKALSHYMICGIKEGRSGSNN